MVARENRNESPGAGWAEPGTPTATPPRFSPMTAHDVLRVLDTLHLAGVHPIAAGGWGVDALVGRQTRAHGNLDLIVFDSERVDALEALDALGYSLLRPDGPSRLVVSTHDGRHVAMTTIDATRQRADVNGTYRYPQPAVDGRGFIVGRPVRCLGALAQFLAHSTPQPSDRDRHDLSAIASRHRFTLPAPHGTGPAIAYHEAREEDVPAMAIVRSTASSMQGLPVSSATALDRAVTYWHDRRRIPGAWVGVITVGGAIGGTIGIAPTPPSATAIEGSATIFALHLSPALDDQHLLDPLLQRAIHHAARLGIADVRLWIPETATTDRRFFEQRGWRPDGTTHESARQSSSGGITVPKLLRYAGR